ncbi:hypothetical protein D3C75_239460 [compost metagenome]
MQYCRQVDVHILRLADSVNAVRSLSFLGRVPVALQMNDVVGADNSQPYPSGHGRHNQQIEAWPGFESGDQLLACQLVGLFCYRGGITVNDRYIQAVDLIQPKLEHALQSLGHHK